MGLGSHSFTCHPHTNHTRLAPQPHSITALWLVLNCAYPRRDGQAELTWVAIVDANIGVNLLNHSIASVCKNLKCKGMHSHTNATFHKLV